MSILKTYNAAIGHGVPNPNRGALWVPRRHPGVGGAWTIGSNVNGVAKVDAFPIDLNSFTRDGASAKIDAGSTLGRSGWIVGA